MAKKTGTSTNHIDLLNDLVTFITEQAALSAVPAAGGTGYAVSDTLTLSGGTFGTAATFTVATVDGGGAVLTVTVAGEGDYTAIPSNPVTTTGGTGSGCTLTVTWKQKHGWTLKRESEKATTATVTAGGTGYSVNDQLTLSGGGYETQAVYNVDTVSGGVVTAVSIVTAGNYWLKPTSPVSTTVSPAGGSGCTLTPVWAPVTAQEKEVILEGNGGGSDQIYVGIRTYQSGSARNWELAGFTGYDANLAFENQPGISPGRYDGSASTNQGAFVTLTNSTITYWFYVDSYSFRVIPRIGTTYMNAYLGFLDRYGTAAEFPYPLLVMGCSSNPDRLFSDTTVGFSGMCDPHAADDENGPGWLRTPGGTWLTVQNSYENLATRYSRQDCVVYPCNTPKTTNVPIQDRSFSGNFVSTDFCPSSGNPGIASAQLLQTPGSPNDVTLLIPATIIESRSSTEYRVHGQMRKVYWFNALTGGTSIVAEDTITISSDTYKVFQNCNRSDHFALFCLKDE